MRAQDFTTEAGTSLDSTQGGKTIKAQVYQTMDKAGYTNIGRGTDASVWAKDAGSVIKIVTTGQTPFLKFYKFCREHSDNPHLPRFVPIQGKDYTVFNLFGKKFLQVSMEKLTKISDDSVEAFVVWYLEHEAKKNTSWSKIVTYLTANKGSELWKFSNDFPMETLQTVYYILKKNPNHWLSFYETFLMLAQYIKKFRGALLDLHDENVMLRSDGTMVITDPYAY
jgi:hypothetical protein